MKIIKTSEDLKDRFLSLFRSYEKFSCLSAWATSGDDFYFYKVLKHQKEKIGKMVIGTHMYQTDPKFIEEFIKESSVHFWKPDGALFHPKVYIFYNKSETLDKAKWSMIIGSANLTRAAFTRNKEVLLEVSSSENNGEIFKQILGTIEQFWNDSGMFSKEYFEKYKNQYNIQKEKISSLTGQYGGNLNDIEKDNDRKDIVDIPVCTMKWEDFVQKVANEKEHSLEDRLRVLAKTRELFSSVSSFSELEKDDRKFIAGLPCSDKFSGWFGSMKGAGEFHKAINENNENISLALDSIPLEGKIKRSHYETFISYFEKTERNGLATATRLLSMKRPDIFVCLDSKNKKNLCNDFSIPQSLGYTEYWTDIVARIKDSVWWNVSMPVDNNEKNIYLGRVALLDALYYSCGKDDEA